MLLFMSVFFQNEKEIYLELKLYGLQFIYFHSLNHTLVGFNFSLNLILASSIVILLVLGFLGPVCAHPFPVPGILTSWHFSFTLPVIY